jgi:hypothetical protein
MPELDRFYREKSDKAAILGVTPTSSAGSIRGLMAEGGYSFPVMVDRGLVRSEYDVRSVPTLIVVDQKGKVVRKIVGGTDFSKLSRLVDDLTG